MMDDLNEILVKELINIGKTVFEDIEYKKLENNQFGFSVNIDILKPQTLLFTSTFNAITAGYNIALIYAYKRIAGLCAKSPRMAHHNPTCNRIYGPHVHVWQFGQGDKDAKPINIKGIEKVSVGIDWFMKEYNIHCTGEIYYPESHQTEVKCYDKLSRNKK